MIKVLVIAVVLLTHLTTFAQTKDDDDPCDKQEEQAIIKTWNACKAKKHKSLKTWKTLEEAKCAIEDAIRKRESKTLLPYVGCDAYDSTRNELHCLSNEFVLVKNNIHTLGEYSLGEKTLKSSKWITPTDKEKKDVLSLCGADYGFKAAFNSCDPTEKIQPIVDIAKSKYGYYLIGLSISGVAIPK
ncbi:hypothetical protein B9G69_015475 [Bdellovibrio sp. SKB1291214]|uniref:hypothetical protein n=1 Tax=Bdellovibrio sp. SKB1291214 TaxID=1732569 RepID=UPI000B51651F|nr:hypothetical protein [Bdellovibrio sp. SKB1291214]UYL08443.1 hypothetical protein B9G69_015475 [Bdellovibrio sp. SKB1291214]